MGVDDSNYRGIAEIQLERRLKFKGIEPEDATRAQRDQAAKDIIEFGQRDGFVPRPRLVMWATSTMTSRRV